ncbi:hypothetical protein BS78_02G256700 [Paspalum vaginatum]|nr:hypothetical protein BS78_02G256700 [Paspalum vaginatum]
MSRANLARVSGGADFTWHCLPPRGKSGCIFLGVRANVLDLSLIVEGEFYIKFHLCNRTDKFEWILMAVYGPAQDEFKSTFLSELTFNILRNSSEKNNDRFNCRWHFLFNVVIDSFDLREIDLTGRQYTWANSLPNPTYEKLDRALVSTEWEFKGVSDHTPLLLDTGTHAFFGSNRQFKFELNWLQREGLQDRVKEIWSKTSKGQNLVQRWNNKLSALWRFLRGWAAQTNEEYKKKKSELQNIICSLDSEAEVRDLNETELECLSQSRDHLTNLLREEEIKYYQRAKAKDVLLGDNNTRYFHMIANGKHRKKKIYSLENGTTKVEGHAELKSFITEFYKGLFGEPEDNSFTLDESINYDIDQVSSHENNLLTTDFSESEIKEAIFSMKNNKTPGPNGFPVEFCQLFWETIKGDLLQMFRDLSKGVLPLFSLNFGVITLIPKIQDANVIQQYRPICLLNVSYKIFTKVATNRLNSVADKKGCRVILKLDFEKAYDKVRWPFLFQTLRMKGFSSKWISWIKTFISDGSIAVNVNDDAGHYFQTKKGLRQGDPLRAKMDGQIEGVIPHLEELELYTKLFGCKAGNLPINYLGIPIHFRKLKNCDWAKVEERFEKRLSSWKGKHLSIGGRLTLINLVLSSLPMYMMSFFSLPKGVLKKLDYFRSRFFWQGDENKRKYRLAK